MKVFRFIFVLILILIFSSFIVPVTATSAGIGKEGMIAAQKGKAKTIAELIKMYDSTSCKVCHQEIWEQWAKSLHSKSIFGTYRTAATFRTTFLNGLKAWPYSGVKRIEDVEVEHLMLCAKCHLPQLEDATDNVAVEIMKNIFDWAESEDEEVYEKAEETLKSLNINCLICHNRNAITHKWTDGYPKDKVVYGNKDGDHFDEHFNKMKTSPIMKESILCGQCHGLGPMFEYDNPSQCATLYGYYLWAYRAEGGRKTCQECHMHKSGLGHNLQSYRDPKMREMALDFNVEATATIWRDGSIYKPLTEVIVEMTNKAGHAIPDG